jgi:FixJ family two-component response regulator
MPEMSGMDLYAEIGRVAPERAGRVVFLTGGAFTRRAGDFLKRVGNPRLEKPFDTRSLKAVLEDVVG